METNTSLKNYQRIYRSLPTLVNIVVVKEVLRWIEGAETFRLKGNGKQQVEEEHIFAG